MVELSPIFPRYTRFEPALRVVQVSDGCAPTIHRFFDTSAISPSGRYIALTRLPFEDRMPRPGDRAQVIVIDLTQGTQVWSHPTAAWDTQLGAQVQWGADDAALYFNVVDPQGWDPHAMRADVTASPVSLAPLAGPVYMVDGQGRRSVGPCLRRIGRIQAGYGVVMPPGTIPENRGIAADDGIYVTDLDSGAHRLLVSFAQIAQALPQVFDRFSPRAGALYGFHAKWNPQGTRIMFVIRWIPHGAGTGPAESCLITCDDTGGDIRLAVGFAAWRGGHHPNWCPDGEHIVMNLRDPCQAAGRFARPRAVLARVTQKLARKMPVLRRLGLVYFAPEAEIYFTKLRYDGKTARLLSRDHIGSGHPTMAADGAHVLSDAYPREQVGFGDGTVPIRWLDCTTDTVEVLVRIDTRPAFGGPRNAWRIDPHPAWSRDGRYIVFNGRAGAYRQVFVADARPLSQCGTDG